MTNYGIYIDGRWIESGSDQRIPSRNPYTGQVWATITQASADQVDAAIAAAQRAFDAGWGALPGVERAKLLSRLADLLDRNAEKLAVADTTDNGKLIRETTGQARFAARLCRFYAGYADKIWGKTIPLDNPGMFDYTMRHPFGVVLLVTAWNSPISLLANKLPAALVAGNCVVVKPSEHASVSTLEFCRLVEEAGFPAGVFNVVTGDAEVGRRLVSAPGFGKISFTGSPAVGREVAAAAARNLVPVSLELGGKSPNIVFADADLKKATVGAMSGIFGASGQSCIAGSRLLVERGVYDRVVEDLSQRSTAIRMGDPLDMATEMGPVANEAQLDRILSSVASAKREGARLVSGGGRASGPGLDGGYFIQPTIFADVDNGMKLAQHEIFGPVLAIIPFDEEAQAVAIANATSYGLASGVWTRDLSRSLRVTRAIRAGTVWVNTYRMSASQTPVGGIKESGYGRERGEEGLAEFMYSKNVMIDFSEDARDPFTLKT